MRKPVPKSTAVAAIACVIAFWPTAVWADPMSTGSTNTVAQGTSSGTASFDPVGIHARAHKPADGGQQVGPLSLNPPTSPDRRGRWGGDAACRTAE